jgi:hypothetical protein
MLGAAAVIIMAGLIIFQAIDDLPLKVTPETPMAKAAFHGKASALDAQDLQKADRPAEPQTVNLDPLPATAAEKISYRAFPPGSETPAPAVPAEGAGKVQFRFPDAADGRMDLDSSTNGKRSAPNPTAALDGDDTLEGLKPGSASTRDGDTRPAADDRRMREVGLVHHDTALPSAATTFAARTTEPTSSASSPAPQSADTDPGRLRQAARATPHLRVAQLARRISSAIQADDHPQTQLLLTKLTKMKGARNTFVLKLKAYALIHQDRLDEARRLLTDVLARDASDFEAGLNMAVVDMKTGRLEHARRRLVQLQQWYPEKRHITTCLMQLPRKR